MVAERLWHAAAAVLALMPVGMAIAHRSAPAFLGISAVLVLCALVAGHGLDRLLRQARTALSTPLGWSVLAFFGWALLSIAWSEVPATSWRAFGEFWPAVAAAFVLSLALPGRVPRSTLWFVAGALAVACVAMLVELQSGLSFRKSLGVRAWEFIFNRPALTVMVTAVPVLAWLASRPSKPTLAAAAVVAGLTATLIAVSWSGAATLGLVLMIVTFPVALMLPRFALAAVAVGFVTAFALAPVKGLVGDSLIPAKLHAQLAESHSRERIDLWLSFGAAIRQQPILGAGFGASPRLHQTSVAAKVAPERRTLLNIGHPHDAAMQIWTELGAVGAALAVLIGLLTLRTMRAWPARTLAPALTLMVGVTAASLVGHGAWQGWWAAAVGAAIVWLRTADHPMREPS
jgi:O-antigen ligase